MAGLGGAVKLTGESEYRRALSQITQSLREMSSAMKVVDTEYAADDKSMEATTAKAAALNNVYAQQDNRLKTLQAQYAAMSEQYADNKTKHEKLVSEYEKEKQTLTQIEDTLGTSSNEYKAQKEKVDALSKAVEKSAKANDYNEKEMSKLRTEINNAQAECNKTTNAMNNLGKAAEDTGKKAATASNGGWSVMKQVLANFTTKALEGVVDGLKKVGAAVLDMGKQALNSYSNYQQLEGGVKKIFGDDAAEIVKNNANNAFKTAGMSANQYLDTVTSFSASLLKSLGGDTEKAAAIADKAIIDMSDNANTFGTDISSIQAAYAGFAKGNFTIELMSVA